MAHKSGIKKVRWGFWTFLLLPLGFMLFFQNCSNDAGFTVDDSTVGRLGEGLLIEDGHQYTNKKIISVQVARSAKNYKTMRISSSSDFGNAVREPYKEKFQFDLGDQYAPDGTKDGEKVIYVELIPSIGAGTILQQTIGLDTVFPSIIPKGILETGMQGKVIAEGTSEKLIWDGEDIKAVTGYSSGLDPEKGLKLGYTSKEDCSVSQVKILQDWTGFKDSHSVKWPQKKPIGYYIFLYLRARSCWKYKGCVIATYVGFVESHSG